MKKILYRKDDPADALVAHVGLVRMVQAMRAVYNQPLRLQDYAVLPLPQWERQCAAQNGYKRSRYAPNTGASIRLRPI